MIGHRIDLDDGELELGWIVGGLRWRHTVGISSNDYRRDPGPHADELSIIANAVGAWGEIAVAKLLGRYWPPTIHVPAKTDPDIPPDIQVRTRSQLDWDLVVRFDDPEDQRYVLVVGVPPRYVVGWIWGHEAKRPEWWKDRGRGPVWWVPQSALHPITIAAARSPQPVTGNGTTPT